MKKVALADGASERSRYICMLDWAVQLEHVLARGDQAVPQGLQADCLAVHQRLQQRYDEFAPLDGGTVQFIEAARVLNREALSQERVRLVVEFSFRCLLRKHQTQADTGHRVDLAPAEVRFAQAQLDSGDERFRLG